MVLWFLFELSSEEIHISADLGVFFFFQVAKNVFVNSFKNYFGFIPQNPSGIPARLEI